LPTSYFDTALTCSISHCQCALQTLGPIGNSSQVHHAVSFFDSRFWEITIGAPARSISTSKRLLILRFSSFANVFATSIDDAFTLRLILILLGVLRMRVISSVFIGQFIQQSCNMRQQKLKTIFKSFHGVYVWCMVYTMKKRIQVTLNPDLVEAAFKIMHARKFASLSEFLESLIREEWDRRTRPTVSAPNDSQSMAMDALPSSTDAQTTPSMTTSRHFKSRVATDSAPQVSAEAKLR